MTKPYPKKKRLSLADIEADFDKAFEIDGDMSVYNQAHEELSKWFIERLEKLRLPDKEEYKGINWEINTLISEVKGGK